jgi:archaellum component FlaC
MPTEAEYHDVAEPPDPSPAEEVAEMRSRFEGELKHLSGQIERCTQAVTSAQHRLESLNLRHRALVAAFDVLEQDVERRNAPKRATANY